MERECEGEEGPLSQCYYRWLSNEYHRYTHQILRALLPFVVEMFQLREVYNALAKRIVNQSCLQASNGLSPLLVLREEPLIPIFCKITLSVGVVTLVPRVS